MNAGIEPGRLFSTPVIVDALDGAVPVNAALETLILARRSADPGVVRTNVGGWHSTSDLLEWARQPMQPVMRRIVDHCDTATVDLESTDGQRRGWRLDGWANVNPPGGAANAAHNHGGCFWSAVYYVRVDPGEGGELVLYDPRLPAIDMHAPMLRFRDMGGEQQVTIKPHAGMIVIFPSWLIHAVRPWTGTGLRISVAVNLSANRRP